jgi:hypothetical protein
VSAKKSLIRAPPFHFAKSLRDPSVYAKTPFPQSGTHKGSSRSGLAARMSDSIAEFAQSDKTGESNCEREDPSPICSNSMAESLESRDISLSDISLRRLPWDTAVTCGFR